MLMLAIAAPAACHAQSLTLAEARAMPVPALARRVLGMAGAAIREIRIDSGEHIGRPGVLSQIYLARAPTRSRFPGLCEAYVFIVNFEPVGKRRADGQTPVAVTEVWRQDWYRVTDDVEWPERVISGQAMIREADARCAAAVPVLWQVGADRKPGFFSGNVGKRYELFPEEAWFATRTLSALDKWQGAWRCSGEDVEFCKDPRAMLAGRPLWEAGDISLDTCADQPQTLCVSVVFSLDSDVHRFASITVATATVHAESDDVPLIRSVTAVVD